MATRKPVLASSLAARAVLVTLAFLLLASLGASRVFDRAGRRAIEKAIADFSYDRTVSLAADIERTLDDGQPTGATTTTIRNAAQQGDLSVVLFLEADTPILTAHGPSLTKALRDFEARDADGELRDSGDTPFVPAFTSAPDTTRFPPVNGRPVRVQDGWPHATEAPVGRNMTVRVVPLRLGRIDTASLGSGLRILLVLLGLSAVVAVGRIMRPVGRLITDVETVGRRSSHKIGPTGVQELDRIAEAAMQGAQRARRAAEEGRLASRSVVQALRELSGRAAEKAAAIDVVAVPPGSRAAVDRLVADAGLLSEIVLDLGLWSDLEADDTKLKTEPCDLGGVLSDAITDACERHDLDEDQFHLDVSEEVDEQLRLDPVRVATVLRHILDNAIHYGALPVDIEVSRAHVKCEISVRDRGPGIEDMDEMRRLFDPFMRASTAGERSGLGLGLRIARRLIELHQGGLAVRNHPQGGLEVRLWLPAPPIRVSRPDPTIDLDEWNAPTQTGTNDIAGLVSTLVPAARRPEVKTAADSPGTFRGVPPAPPASEVSNPRLPAVPLAGVEPLTPPPESQDAPDETFSPDGDGPRIPAASKATTTTSAKAKAKAAPPRAKATTEAKATTKAKATSKPRVVREPEPSDRSEEDFEPF